MGTVGTHDQSGSTTEVNYDSYKPEVITYSDYYPFHMQMDGRSDVSNGYRYHGANGQESEREITGSGSHSSAEYWMYDERLGRRWNVDPLHFLFAPISPYSTFLNNPIRLVDFLGLAAEDPIKIESGGTYNEKNNEDVSSLPQCADDCQEITFNYESTKSENGYISSVTYTYNASTEKWATVYEKVGGEGGYGTFEGVDRDGYAGNSIESLQTKSDKAKENNIVANNSTIKASGNIPNLGNNPVNHTGNSKSTQTAVADFKKATDFKNMWKSDPVVNSWRETVGMASVATDFRKNNLTNKLNSAEIKIKSKNYILGVKTELQLLSKAKGFLGPAGTVISFIDFASDPSWESAGKLGLDLFVGGLSSAVPLVGLIYFGGGLLGWW